MGQNESPEPPTERAAAPKRATVSGGNAHGAQPRPMGSNTALIGQKQIEADLAREQLKIQAELAREEIKDRDRARDDRRAMIREAFAGVVKLIQSLFSGLQGLSNSCASHLTWRNLGIVGIVLLGVLAIVYNRALIVGGLGLDVKVGEATTVGPVDDEVPPEEDAAPAPDDTDA
jgi:hypothetical protein